MRERRNDSRRSRVRTASAASSVASIGLRLWAKAADRPVDSLAICVAGATSLVIVVNAVFLQSGPHPAPFFANPPSQPQPAEMRPSIAVAAAPKPADAVPTRPTTSPRTPQTVSARRNDLIADLIASSVGPSSRVLAVQRVLSAFGYGQIKPSGVVDEATSAAIEKFESEHKLPITGRLSDRLLSELAAMTGHSIP